MVGNDGESNDDEATAKVTPSDSSGNQRCHIDYSRFSTLGCNPNKRSRQVICYCSIFNE